MYIIYFYLVFENKCSLNLFNVLQYYRPSLYKTLSKHSNLVCFIILKYTNLLQKCFKIIICLFKPKISFVLR